MQIRCANTDTLYTFSSNLQNKYKTQRFDGTENMRSTLQPKHSLNSIVHGNGRATQRDQALYSIFDYIQRMLAATVYLLNIFARQIHHSIEQTNLYRWKNRKTLSSMLFIRLRALVWIVVLLCVCKQTCRCRWFL